MDPVTGLSLGRIAVGVVSVAKPELAGKLFQLDVAGNRQLPYMTRMFGSREIAIGVLTLVSSGKARRRLVLAGIGIDTADAGASIVASQNGSLSKPAGAILTAPAVGAVAAGISWLVTDRRARKAAKRAARLELVQPVAA
ncbi:MAG: hypothetical protein JWO46_1116 [Nocardioidaceae bacterium]|nr:hypothetical protein [Nocardioidaceae bacterium]